MTKEAKPDDYKNLVDLQAIFSEGKQRLSALELEVQEEFTGLVDARRKEFTELQRTIADAEAAIETIARTHPEWFEAKRSVKSPYGTVKLTKSTKLEASNEEASILRIEHAGKGEELVRTAKTLNLEALEALSDAELKAYGIVRIREENVKVTEAKIDLGKAVRAAEKAEVAA